MRKLFLLSAAKSRIKKGIHVKNKRVRCQKHYSNSLSGIAVDILTQLTMSKPLDARSACVLKA